MFNCFFPLFPSPIVSERTKTEKVLIAEVLVQADGVSVIRPASQVVFIDPRLEFRSVTPSEQIKNGIAKSVNSESFLKPSFEDVERVSAVLATIDDKFSYQAALDKYAASVAEPKTDEPKTDEPKTE